MSDEDIGSAGSGADVGGASRVGHGRTSRRIPCAICGRLFPRGQLLPFDLLSPPLSEFAHERHPELTAASLLCQDDLTALRAGFIPRLLERERGELSNLELEVVESLAAQETLAEDVERSFESRRTFGDRMADGLARFGGSWGFIGVFAAILVIWIAFNLVAAGRGQFDPYPFILLNLVLSCLAAIQAPVIMMSQKRLEVRDRLRAENDFKINLKAELEIRHLHEKVDHLLTQQWERLAQIQEVQIDLLEAMTARKR
ncbi:DUF1003 domain-containing protein [Xanthobacter autotrophicus]|uniref:DUF1003 domain-containing protein n=1 Tax=Xanthobacter autotrophicus TaxID=280 RepID=UPI00372BA360